VCEEGDGNRGAESWGKKKTRTKTRFNRRSELATPPEKMHEKSMFLVSSRLSIKPVNRLIADDRCDVCLQ
jgi:hypothetical protein